MDYAPLYDLDAQVTTEKAAQAAQVAEHRIRGWRTRGWVGPDGQHRTLAIVARDWRGRPLHRLGDILDAERDTRRSGKSHRRCEPPGERLRSLADELLAAA